MARRSGFMGLLNAVASAAAKAARQAEAERKRQIRENERLMRAAIKSRQTDDRERERQQRAAEKRAEQACREQAARQKEIEKQRLNDERFKEKQRILNDKELLQKDKISTINNTLRSKEEKLNYILNRESETSYKNSVLVSQVNSLGTILGHTLTIDDSIYFSGLKLIGEFTAFSYPAGFLSMPKENLDSLKADHERKKEAFYQNKNAKNQEIDDFEASYRFGDGEAIISYNTMVLERSQYPEGFPQQFRIAYSQESKELVIDYELPPLSIIPTAKEFRYVKNKDFIEEKPRKTTDINELYQDVVAAITIRTIHEVFEADQGNHTDVAVFNGYVNAVDPASGKDIRPYLVSARAVKDSFVDFNLARIDKRACLRNIGAQVSSQPAAMQPVKPIVDINMTDKRFVEYGDVLSGLDNRPNLMDLNPWEFETLVSNLFAKMGLETKLTRSSRDGGVDAVAFDTRPILGGKVVIQAKRYKNTVGVSAVRDLYGTMLNEGANKGILVATSGYGPDAFNFAKDKPIELIDGGGLLYMLDKVGIEAKIIMPDEG